MHVLCMASGQNAAYMNRPSNADKYVHDRLVRIYWTMKHPRFAHVQKGTQRRDNRARGMPLMSFLGQLHQSIYSQLVLISLKK
jgi:hypothetical protein